MCDKASLREGLCLVFWRKSEEARPGMSLGQLAVAQHKLSQVSTQNMYIQ